MCLLSSRCCLQEHLTSDLVYFLKWNAVKLGDILDKRAQLKSVPVRDWNNCGITPFLNQLLFQIHRCCYIIINIWVVSSIRAEETREQQTIFNWVNLGNTEGISHKRACGRATTWTCEHTIIGSVCNRFHGQEIF